jgi:hypothetical protein
MGTAQGENQDTRIVGFCTKSRREIDAIFTHPNDSSWPGRGSEDVNLLANNRSFGKDRGYLNYLNWVAASTGG